MSNLNRQSSTEWEQYRHIVQAINDKTTKDVKHLILEAADALAETEEYKHQRHRICARLCVDCPYASSYIREILPDDFKDLLKKSNAKQRFAPVAELYTQEIYELTELLQKYARKDLPVDPSVQPKILRLLQTLKNQLRKMERAEVSKDALHSATFSDGEVFLFPDRSDLEFPNTVNLWPKVLGFYALFCKEMNSEITMSEFINYSIIRLYEDYYRMKFVAYRRQS
ncbi:MAG: hypothetical protein ACE5J2_01825 [Nitrososphaerales archaeon]